MATYQERKNKNGATKIKAICRIWLDGKQINRTKSFDTREEAERWATETEAQMQSDKVRKVYGSPSMVGSQIPTFKPSLEEGGSNVTVLDMVEGTAKALEKIQKHLGKTELSFINTSCLINYFIMRSRERATVIEIENEKLILRDIVSQFSGSGTNRANIVALAFQAAQADGAVFYEA